MKVIPTDFTISRAENGKKLYTNIHNQLVTSVPKTGSIGDSLVDKLPSLDIEEASNYINSLDNTFTYAIRPEDNVVVIDTDSVEAFNDIELVLFKIQQKTFTVHTDKQYAHYYFHPTDYFKQSPVYHTSRRAIKSPKIDIMQGKSLVWGYKATSTKFIDDGADMFKDMIPIPDELVDYLIQKLAVASESKQVSEYTHNVTYIGKKLITALENYTNDRDNYKHFNTKEAWEKHFSSIAPYFTPNKYKDGMDDMLYPDSLDHDISASEFIQATIFKMLRDPSISYGNGMVLLGIITGEMWSSPITGKQLEEYTTNYRTQNAKGVSYQFDSKYLEMSAVSINDGPYGKIYRHTNGEYFVETQNNLINLGTWPKFIVNITSRGIEYQGLKKLLNAKHQMELAKEFSTITITEDITKPYGAIETQGDLVLYNTFRKTTYHRIILGIEDEPRATKEDFPHILMLLNNLVADHGEFDEQEDIVNKFIFFLAMKGKYFIYSPLLFQLNGHGGIGKGYLADLIAKIFGGKYNLDLGRSNKQFNKDSANKLIAEQAEIPVTGENLELLKAQTGNKVKTIEPKGIDAYTVPNIETILVSTNDDSVFEDARRVVLFQAFTASKWDFHKYDALITLELRSFCAYMRDLPDNTYPGPLLSDASFWNQQTMENAKKIRQASYNYGHEGQLKDLLNRHHDMTGEELDGALQEILSHTYWWLLLVRKHILKIVLSTPGITNYGNECPHDIKPSTMKKLGFKVQQEPNHRLHPYVDFNKHPYTIEMELTPEQHMYFSSKALEIEEKNTMPSRTQPKI